MSRKLAIGPGHDDALGFCRPDVIDPLVEAFKAGVDQTQIQENLTLTTEERCQKFLRLAQMALELQDAGQRLRAQDPRWGVTSDDRH